MAYTLMHSMLSGQAVYSDSARLSYLLTPGTNLDLLSLSLSPISFCVL